MPASETFNAGYFKKGYWNAGYWMDPALTTDPRSPTAPTSKTVTSLTADEPLDPGLGDVSKITVPPPGDAAT